MDSLFKKNQKEKSIGLIKNNSPVFYNSKGGKKFRGSERDFVLVDASYNIFQPIKNEVVKYFKENKISWWGGKLPTGHVLSSQIACVNHLFSIRHDKDAVLALLKNVSPDFLDVFEINTDKYDPGFIQFEAVSDYDYLNEGIPIRGNNCTSIDALIYALHKDQTKWLIPIEWKYTECYSNQNKAIEGFKKDPINCKGNIRKGRYTQLINKSKQLDNNDHTCYYYEPFYQLMRQTLWVERMIENKSKEKLKGDNYLHINVIPDRNTELLEKRYKCSGKNMEDTWRSMLKDQTKYKIITPDVLMQGVNKKTYKDLLDYLSIRYWC